MKKHLMITLDFDVWILAKQKIDNLSNELNEYLKKRLKVQENEREQTIEQLKQTKLEKLAEANAVQETIEQLEQKKKKEKDDIIYEWSSDSDRGR